MNCFFYKFLVFHNYKFLFKKLKCFLFLHPSVLLIPTHTLSNMQSNNKSNIDAFGRDVSLKYQYQTMLTKFQGMSWSDISFTIEDEEAIKLQQKKAADREELIKVLAERKKLVEQGLYELEEGEVVEL